MNGTHLDYSIFTWEEDSCHLNLSERYLKQVGSGVSMWNPLCACDNDLTWAEICHSDVFTSASRSSYTEGNQQPVLLWIRVQ